MHEHLETLRAIEKVRGMANVHSTAHCVPHFVMLQLARILRIVVIICALHSLSDIFNSRIMTESNRKNSI